MPGWKCGQTDNHSYILLRKDKRQYLLTCKVSRYCILALHGGINTRTTGLVRVYMLQTIRKISLYIIHTCLARTKALSRTTTQLYVIVCMQRQNV